MLPTEKQMCFTSGVGGLKFVTFMLSISNSNFTVVEIHITFIKILIPEVHIEVHLITVPVYLNGILVDYSTTAA